ncbi:signal recognition particle receptor subunit beta-like [Ptychodera flava]|uniref:signal recognition particle receptor subunit beta-like n=1 Tax=Ptychodera flava TaxID=63121 RepID=UPI00396A9B0B
MATRRADGLDQYVNLIKEELATQDPLILGVGVAVVVVILTILILKFISGRKNTRRSVLLVGLCDAGKTVLYSRLISGKYAKTQTSIKENSGSYEIKNEKKGRLKVVDLPGHERLRNQSLDQFKDQARGIIFVVDSATLQKEIKEVAECLYNVLSDNVISYNSPPILVACNKSDVTTAKSANIIKTQLEKEMNTLRVTRSAALAGTDSSGGSNNVFLGKQGKDFEFSHLSPIQVEFVECSAKGSKGEAADAEIGEIEKWLAKIA